MKDSFYLLFWMFFITQLIILGIGVCFAFIPQMELLAIAHFTIFTTLQFSDVGIIAMLRDYRIIKKHDQSLIIELNRRFSLRKKKEIKIKR